jgi:electron transfer flavoprotein beta subunit
MNRFDEHAIEAAVAIKEQTTDCQIDVVSVAPPSVESILKRAMGMGADNAFIVSIEPETYYSPAHIAGQLAKFAQERCYDLIFTGIMSEDEMNAQTGQMLAAHLHMPSVTGVVAMDMTNKLSIEREREGGIREKLIAKMPILLTIQAGINCPRYPSLSALLRAKKKKVQIIEYENQLDNDQSIIQISPAQKMRKGLILSGSTSEKARQFIDIVTRKGVI